MKKKIDTVKTEGEIKAPDYWAEKIKSSSSTVCTGKYYLDVINPNLTGTSGDFKLMKGYGENAEVLRDMRFWQKLSIFGMAAAVRSEDNSLYVSASYSEPEPKSIILEGIVPKKVFCYEMHTSRKSPDSRGHNPPFKVFFSLPEDEANEFIGQIKDEPDLIDDVFQSLYPGLLNNDKFGRVKATKLKVVETPHNNYDYNTAVPVYRDSTKTELEFSHPMGEMDAN